MACQQLNVRIHGVQKNEQFLSHTINPLGNGCTDAFIVFSMLPTLLVVGVVYIFSCAMEIVFLGRSEIDSRDTVAFLMIF